MKDLWNKSKLYIATALSVVALNNAVAGNHVVAGSIKSIPHRVPVHADVIMTQRFAPFVSDTLKYKNYFSKSYPDGKYSLEVIANNHYVYLDTNFVVNKDTVLDLRLIRGRHDDGTPILVCPHVFYKGSILKFAKYQYTRQDYYAPRFDVSNWPSPRRRLFVSGISGQSRANLDYILAVNSTGPAGIYYDEKDTDSSGGIRIYGVPAGDPRLGGSIATTIVYINRISTNPIVDVITGAIIYAVNDQFPLSTYAFADELLHAEDQDHYSVWPYHVLTQFGLHSLATETSPDEMYITAINQTLKLGDDWRKYRDTIKTMSPVFTVLYGQGWNMVSIPSVHDNLSVNNVFPEAIGNLFAYNNGYRPVDVLEYGGGYWMKLASPIEKVFTGQKLLQDTINLNFRWNIIGGIGYPVPIDSIELLDSVQLLSNFFKYNGNGYSVADTIRPGEAVWVKANKNGRLVLKKPGLGANTANNLPQLSYDTDIPDTPTQITTIKVDNSIIPMKFTLFQNYPNPFNPSTQISFELPTRTNVSLSVYNIVGQEVERLLNGSFPAGSYTVTWKVENEPSGVYYYRLTTDEFTSVKKMILIR